MVFLELSSRQPFGSSWIVLAHSSSIIYDPSFIQKLEQVPGDVGAVAPFGYEYFLPDGTWMRCPNTYGMYSEYSLTDGMFNRRVAGTVSVTGSHEVAMLDGPFVAIRGGYLPILRNWHKLYRFGDGRGCVPYVVSMMISIFPTISTRTTLKRLKMKSWLAMPPSSLTCALSITSFQDRLAGTLILS